MKEYEIVAKFCNACAGDSRPQTFFEEAELASMDDFVRMKHGKDFDKFFRADARKIHRTRRGKRIPRGDPVPA